MSPSRAVPADIRKFVSQYLTSVEHLETFILLHRAPTKYWSASEIAAELQIEDAAAERVLEQLASKNLLDIKISNDVLYRFNPVAASVDEAAARVAEFYLRQRIVVTNLVMSAPGPMQAFADAFRLKKDEGHG